MAKGYKTGGRKKGTPNKVTAELRQMIGMFVDDNAHKLQEWLDDIAKHDPEKAFKCYMSVVEYALPKLNRSEIQTDSTVMDISTILRDVSRRGGGSDI